jgi:hypothetical protein
MSRPVYFYGEKCQYCNQLHNLLSNYPQLAGSVVFYDIKRGNLPPGVKTVPTIMHLNKYYTGAEAFRWVNEQIKHFIDQAQAQQAQQQQQQQQQMMAQQGQMGQVMAGGQMGGQMGQSPSVQQQMAQMDQRAHQMNPQGQQGPSGDGELEGFDCEGGSCGMTSLSLFQNNDFKGLCDDGSCLITKPGDSMTLKDWDLQQSGGQQQQQQGQGQMNQPMNQPMMPQGQMNQQMMSQQFPQNNYAQPRGFQ